MKLVCIKGRAGSGKTRFIMHAIEQSKKRAVLIVPNQYTLSAERDIINKLGLKSFIDIEVLSFSRLEERILELAGGVQLPFLNTRGKSMIITRLMMQNKQSLKAFSAYTNSPSFALSVAEVIAELKRFGIEPEDFKNVAKGARHQDIALIYQLYNEHITANYIDTQDKMNIAIRKLGESAFVKDADIYIDGFEMLTAQIYSFVRELIAQAHSVTVTFRLGSDKDGDNHIFGAEFKHYNRIKSIAKDAGAPIDEIRLPIENAPWGNTRNTGPLAHAEKNLFAVKKEVSHDSSGINLLREPSINREAEACAKEMLRLVRDENYRWRDMAVVCDDIAQYAPCLKKAFKQYGIPCFMDIKRPVSRHSFAKYVLNLVSAVKNNFSSREIISLLKIGFTEIDFTQSDKIEKAIRLLGAKWLGENYRPKQEEQNYTVLYEKLLAGLYRLSNRFRSQNTAGGMAQALYEYLLESGSVARLEEFILSLKEKGQLDEAAEAVAAYNAVCSVLEQAHDVLDTEKMTAKDFYNILLSGLEAEDSAVIPSNIDSVSLGTLQRSKTSDIKALFIIGANEGSFPVQISDSGLISADDKAEFAKEGLFIGHDEQDRAAEEELNIYTAVSKPMQRLYISYSQKNGEGGEAYPAQAVNDITACFSSLLPKTGDYNDPTELINTYDSTLIHVVQHLSKQGENCDDVWQAVRQQYKKAGDQRVEKALSAKTAYRDELSKEAVDALFSRNFSSTRLETFAACPFLHLIRYGLKLAENQEYDYTAKEHGTYYHDALEAFVNTCADKGWENISQQQSEQLMDDICTTLDKKLLADAHQEDEREKHILSVMRQNLIGSANAILMQMQNGAFRPAGAETAFFGDGELPAFQITKGMRITGRIDRIDTYTKNGRKYIRVIDYKSGGDVFNPTKLFYGTALQLPLYTSAVASATGAVPAGMFIMPLKEGVVKGWNKDEANKQKMLSHKLSGVVLADDEIIRAMDKDIDQGSSILSVSINKDGSISRQSAAEDEEKLKKILNFGINKAQELIEDINSGVSLPLPYYGELNSCAYCQMKGTCGYEKMRGDKARFTKKIGLERITEEDA